MNRYSVLAFLVTASCSPAYDGSAEDTAEVAVAAAEGAEEAAYGKPEETAVKSGWQYNEQKDEMRGEASKVAFRDAERPLVLDFPYGTSTPQLWLRQDPKFGFDIFITANAQFICHSYRNDTVSVKFDDGPIKEWKCGEAEAGSSEIVFLLNQKAFLDQIQKSKIMIIEVEVYNAGRQQIKFSLEGLKWGDKS